MKRIVALFMALILMVSGIPFFVHAQEDNDTVFQEKVESDQVDSSDVSNEEVTGEEETEDPDIPSDENREDPESESEDVSEQEEAEEQMPDGDSEEEQEETSGEITEGVNQEQQFPETQAVQEKDVVLEKPELLYQAHVQIEGWQNWKHESELCGTEGQSRRMEAIRIKLQDGENKITGGVEYRAHVQDYGWMNWVKNGELCGTEGKSKRMEAIEIRLTGELAEQYDIYYRVHIQNYGWLDWVKNGESAGSSGLSTRMESCMITLVKKGNQSPSNGGRGFIKAYANQEFTYRGHIQNIGNTASFINGQTLGTVGKSLRLEALSVQLDTSDPLTMDGNVEYSVHVQNEGWQSFKTSGQMAGTQGKSLRMEAVKIRLTGELSKCYDIYYRTHVQNFGWMGWAKNGAAAGSEGYSYRMEAIQIVLRPKTQVAPGNTSNTFKKKEVVVNIKKTLSSALGFDGAKIVKELEAHQNDSYYLGTAYMPLKTPVNLYELLYPKGDKRSDGYSGMNCTGFVVYVTQKCGANLGQIGQMGLRGGVCNASNWFRYFKNGNIEFYKYNSVSALLKDGKAEQGDIIYCEPVNWSQPGADCHIGFFWGRTPGENRFWHSSTTPGSGNQISVIVPASSPSYFYLVKM